MPRANSTFSIRSLEEDTLSCRRSPSCNEFSHLSPLGEPTSQAADFSMGFLPPWLPIVDLLHMNSFLKMKEDRGEKEC